MSDSSGEEDILVRAALAADCKQSANGGAAAPLVPASAATASTGGVGAEIADSEDLQLEQALRRLQLSEPPAQLIEPPATPPVTASLAEQQLAETLVVASQLAAQALAELLGEGRQPGTASAVDSRAAATSSDCYQTASRATRLDWARAAGEAARRKLDGRQTTVPRTPRLREAPVKRYWVLVRGVVAGERGICTGAFTQFRGYVQRNGQLPREVVFHGWATIIEAVTYWRACFPDRGPAPVPALAPRP